MVLLFSAFLLTLLVITAIAIIRTTDLFAAVMLSGIFSLLMAAIFFTLDAADVALTEAAVGAGISTVLFLSALALTEQHERSIKPSRWLAVPVLVATALIIYATFDKPRLGDPDAPVHQHVAPWYLEKTPELIDIPNVVTAVLGSFRGYDTLGEVFVVLTAAIGVMILLGTRYSSAASPVQPASSSDSLRHHLIPRVIGRLMIPFIVLFGLYVQFHGDYGPGGGFQAGALVAAAIILYALLEGEGPALTVVPLSAITAMMAGGARLYTLVGLAGIVMGGNFLDYSVLLSDPIAGQHLGILLIELGVGVTVCGCMLSIFHAFAARDNQ
jgi:multicomponent Na+:H+ antiporter subunit B